MSLPVSNGPGQPRDPRLRDRTVGAAVPNGTERLRGPFKADPNAATNLTAVAIRDSVAPPTDLPSIPGYEILSVLGRGGMGVVYKARQIGLNRLVAIKTILTGAQAGPTELARFRAEAESVAQLQHPNIVQIYEVGELHNQPYFSLEYVEGGSLAEQINGRIMPPRQAAHLLEILSHAMQYAHQHGIIHRDLKPANILLQPFGSAGAAANTPVVPGPEIDSDEIKMGRTGATSLIGIGVPKITDFGLAKRLSAEGLSLTATGCVIGTPNYMAPEQVMGQNKDIGPGTDVYALGVMLYEMLTGRLPFTADSPLQVAAEAVRAEPLPPQKIQPDLPTDLVTICLKCLRKDPKDRYPTTQALAKDLRRFLNGMPIVARPRGPLKRALAAIKREPLILVAILLLTCSAGALAMTSSVVDSAVVLTGVAAVSGLIWQWRRAEWERRTAVEQRAQAREARREGDRLRLAAENARRDAVAQAQRAAQALRDSESHLYSLRIALADREWQANNVVRVENILRSCPVHLRSWEWHYLKRLLHTELLTFTGHRDWVRGIAFHPQGREIISAGGMDQVAKIWDAASGKEIRTLTGHTGCIRAVTYSPDGNRVATAGDDQTIRVYEARSGACLSTLSGHQESILSVVFSPDGQRLVSASTDCTLRLWNVAAAREIGTIRVSPHARPSQSSTLTAESFSRGAVPLFDVAFSPDGKRIAAAGKDRCVCIYDAANGQELLALYGHTDAITGIAFSPDGALLASSGGYDATGKIWDAATGHELSTLRGHAHAVWQVAFHPDSKHVATAGGDGCVRVWDAASGRCQFTLRGHTKAVTGVAFSPNGQLLASASTDGTVKVWQALTPQEAVPFGVHQDIECIAWRPDGVQLATGGAKGDLQLWDAAARQVGAVLHGEAGKTAHEGCTIALAYSPDGKRLASGGSDGMLRVWDPITTSVAAVLAGHARPISAIGFSPLQSLVASASLDGTAKIWDFAANRNCALTFRGHIGQLVGLAYQPQGHLVVTASVDPLRTHLEVKFWKPDTGDEVRTLLIPRHQEETAIVCFSPNGVRLATASHGYCAKVWETHTGRELYSLVGHGRPIISLAFSPDGQRIVTASLDQTIKIWDVTTGHEVLTIREHTADVIQAVFNPNGRQLVTIHRNGMIRVW